MLEISVSQYHLDGISKGLLDINMGLEYNPSSHSIKINSLKSYRNILDFEEGYIKSFPKP